MLHKVWLKICEVTQWKTFHFKTFKVHKDEEIVSNGSNFAQTILKLC